MLIFERKHFVKLMCSWNQVISQEEHGVDNVVCVFLKLLRTYNPPVSKISIFWVAHGPTVIQDGCLGNHVSTSSFQFPQRGKFDLAGGPWRLL